MATNLATSKLFNLKVLVRFFIIILKKIENKLHLMWSDSSFLPYLNPATVLDYFCDQRNPFYDSSCNNQILKMQGKNSFKKFCKKYKLMDQFFL